MYDQTDEPAFVGPVDMGFQSADLDIEPALRVVLVMESRLEMVFKTSDAELECVEIDSCASINTFHQNRTPLMPAARVFGSACRTRHVRHA